MAGNASVMAANVSQLLDELNRREIRLLAPVIAFMVVLMVLGIVGNSLVCYVYGTRMKKTTVNTFIVWLAVLDLSTCIIGIPMEIYDIVQNYYFDLPAFCKILRFTIYLTVMTSVATLVFIAFDRYFKICKPLKKTLLNRSRVTVMISLAMGLTLSWPSLVLFGRTKVEVPGSNVSGVDCGIDEVFQGSWYPRIYLFVLALAFLAGATILTVLYTLLGYTLHKRNQRPLGNTMRMPTMEPESSDNGRRATKVGKGKGGDTISQSGTFRPRKSRRRYKVARTSFVFFVITLAFVLSFLPSLALMTLNTVKTKFAQTLTDHQFVAYSLFLRTYFINNSINPIIYGFLNQLFRIEVFDIVRRMTSRVSRRPAQPVSVTSE